MKSKRCPTCGSKLARYKHKLNIPLVNALNRLYFHNGPGKISDLALTHSQYNNFHKLGYWSLIKQVTDSQYEISPEGILFIRGKISVPLYAITFHGRVEKLDGRLVKITDIDGGSWVRKDYRREAI